MLSSLLKIEQLLKCDICLSTLRQTRIVAECGHRFCLDCIKEKLATSETCPTCQLPALVDDLLKDPMHDNLVSYVSKLKTALLSHALTPLEDSLLCKRELSNTQESEDLEEEYRDLPPTKKFKKSDSFLDDLLSERLSRHKYQPVYVVPSDDDDMVDATLTIVGAPRIPDDSVPHIPDETINAPCIPDETETTSETWQCTECEFSNKSYIQTCDVCKKFKNRNTRAVTRKGKSRVSDIVQIVHNVALPRPSRSNTMADQSLDSATLPPRQSREARTPKKDVHIIFTAVTHEEMQVIDEQIERVVESKLQINIGTELKDMKRTTHVISSVDRKKQCHRTLKYLDGVVTGKWIVSPKWLLDSMKAKQWLPEQAYEVQGDAKSGLTHAPEKGRKKHSKLFEGMNFYFAGEFSEKHNRKDLSLLISDGGGNVDKRKPTGFGYKVTADTPLNFNHPIVIYCKNTTTKKLTWLHEYQVRDPTWIIDSISQLEINN